MAVDKETEEKKNQRALAYKEERRKSGRYDKIQKTNKNTAIDLGNVLPYVNKVLVPNAASMVQQKQPVTQMASSAGNKAKKIQQKAQPSEMRQVHLRLTILGIICRKQKA